MPAPVGDAGDQAESAGPLDGGHRFRDAEPGVGAWRGSEIDPACTGPTIDLALAVVDARCAIGSTEAKRLRSILEADGGIGLLRQEAAKQPNGRVVVRVLSAAPVPLALPLSWHPKLPAFTALAEDDRHQLFELEAPRLEARDDGRAHFARVVLPPSGVAFATSAVSANVVKRIAPSCPEGGACGPAELPPGRYSLHVGQLLVDVEAGPPATIEWTRSLGALR